MSTCTSYRRTRILAALGAVALSGCGSTVRPLGDYAARSGGPAPTGMSEGAVVLVSPRCSLHTAPSRGEAIDGGTATAEGDPAFREVVPWTVREAAVVLDGATGHVLLGVQHGTTERWITFAPGDARCLRAAPPGAAAVFALVGKPLVRSLDPRRCSHLEGRGSAAYSTLLGDDSLPLGVTRVRLGEGADHALWVELANGALVREDVARSCFVPASEAAASAPVPGRSSLDAALGVDLRRCARSSDGASEHVECRTSVGVWQGLVDGDVVSLVRSRRTLGDLHFLDGTLVDGKRWERATMSVAMGTSDDGSARKVQQTLVRSLQTTSKRLDGIRMVSAAADARTRLRIDVKDVRVFPVQTVETTEHSQYQDGEREVPNPAFPGAERAVEQARGRLEQARTAYEEAKEQAERDRQMRQQLLDECRRQAAQLQDKNWGTVADTACNIGGVINGQTGDVARDQVDSAQSSLASAEDALSSTPRTVREPIMKSWAYKAVRHTRRAVGVVTVAIADKDAAAPVVVELPVEATWSGAEITADAAHNVPGSSVDRHQLASEDVVVAPLAARAGEVVAAKVRDVAANARRGALRRALIDAGAKVVPGYESVDASALHVSTGRTFAPLRRGALPAAREVALEFPDVKLGPGQCLVAAIATDAPTGSVAIRSRDGRAADLRGGPVATVELCHEDVGERIPDLVVASPGGAARWGAYRTAVEAPR